MHDANYIKLDVLMLRFYQLPTTRMLRLEIVNVNWYNIGLITFRQ
jgi:hypothetical protein